MMRISDCRVISPTRDIYSLLAPRNTAERGQKEWKGWMVGRSAIECFLLSLAQSLPSQTPTSCDSLCACKQPQVNSTCHQKQKERQEKKCENSRGTSWEEEGVWQKWEQGERGIGEVTVTKTHCTHMSQNNKYAIFFLKPVLMPTTLNTW